jgi:hypothetical protein
MINEPETWKYPLGSKITIRLKNDDEWRNFVLMYFNYKEKSIKVDDGSTIRLEEIDIIQKTRPEVGIASKMFMTFGVAWLGFGLITGELGKNKDSGYSDLAIGLSSVGLGYGMHKAFYKRKFKIGTRYRLRLLDLRVY